MEVSVMASDQQHWELVEYPQLTLLVVSTVTSSHQQLIQMENSSREVSLDRIGLRLIKASMFYVLQLTH